MRPRGGTTGTLRAALLLLAGVAVFALGLLPAHAAAGPEASSHSNSPTHVTTGHLAGEHAPTTSHGEGGGTTQPDHAAGPHHAQADEPLCHSAQTSSALTCKQVGSADLTLLLMALLAAGGAGVLFLLAPALDSERARRAWRHSVRPIRPQFGPKLLLLDCIARI